MVSAPPRNTSRVRSGPRAPGPLSAINRYVVVAQDSPRQKQVFLAYHQPLRHNGQRTHMDVHGKGLYIFGGQKGRGKGNDRGIRGAQNFFHAVTKREARVLVKAGIASLMTAITGTP